MPISVWVLFLIMRSSAAVLIGLAGNALFGAWWLDPVIGLIVAAVAVKEGRHRGGT